MQPLLDARRRSIPTRWVRGDRRPATSFAGHGNRWRGATHGSRHDAEAAPERRSRAPRRHRRSRRSRTTPSSLTATPARWSLRMEPIDWLCVPQLRLAERVRHAAGPAGRHLPAGAVRHQRPERTRNYEPGTNTLVTTWNTPGGWVVVRDALTMGPREGEDRSHRTPRPPADDDADHMLVRTVECIDGQVEIELVCEPVFDYGRTPAHWTLADGNDRTQPMRPAAAKRCGCRADMALGVEGDRVRGAARRSRRASRCTVRCPGPTAWRRPQTSMKRTRGWTRRRASGAAGCGRARIPDHRWRYPISAFRAGDQGADVHADRRDGSRAHHVACPRRPAASGTGTTATAGCATRRSRCRRCTG